MKWLEEKGVRLEKDEGIELELDGKKFLVKCAYLGFFGSKLLLCVDLASPTASEPVKRFMESYARIRRARYAVVEAGEDVWIYDVQRKEESKDVELEERSGRKVEPDSKDFRVAVAYYNLIHCQCGVDNEGDSVCRLSFER